MSIDRTDHTVTDRGFKWMNPVPGEHGGRAELFESSAAAQPCVVLKVTEPNDLNVGESSGAHDATVLLTAKNAWLLKEQLEWLLENHYQGDARPASAR